MPLLTLMQGAHAHKDLQLMPALRENAEKANNPHEKEIDCLDNVEQQKVFIYDVDKSNFWLVPLLSFVLHLVLEWASARDFDIHYAVDG